MADSPEHYMTGLGLSQYVYGAERLGLPVRIADIPGGRLEVETLMAAIARDKKVSGGTLTFILTRGIGESFVARDVPADAVSAFLLEEIDR